MVWPRTHKTINSHYITHWIREKQLTTLNENMVVNNVDWDKELHKAAR